MKKSKIAIIDTGSANLHSVLKACKKVGTNVSITSNKKDLYKSDGIIFPGVGSSDAVMNYVEKNNLIDTITNLMEKGHAFLNICLGMQVLFNSSEEGNKNGLGFIDGEVKKFRRDDNNKKLKIPHMGWNTVNLKSTHTIFNGVPNKSNFYFVHSYYCKPKENKYFLGETNYGISFCSVSVKKNVIATQFHPEKSGDLGLEIYDNFTKKVSG